MLRIIHAAVCTNFKLCIYNIYTYIQYTIRIDLQITIRPSFLIWFNVAEDFDYFLPESCCTTEIETIVEYLRNILICECTQTALSYYM